MRTGIWRFCSSAATAEAALWLIEQGGMLGEGPGAEGTAVVVSVGKKRSVDADAVTIGGSVQRDVDGGVVRVGEEGALVERNVGVGVAQHQSCDAAALQFLAQAAGEGDGDVFFQ